MVQPPFIRQLTVEEAEANNNIGPTSPEQVRPVLLNRLMAERIRLLSEIVFHNPLPREIVVNNIFVPLDDRIRRINEVIQNNSILPTQAPSERLSADSESASELENPHFL